MLIDASSAVMPQAARLTMIGMMSAASLGEESSPGNRGGGRVSSRQVGQSQQTTSGDPSGVSWTSTGTGGSGCRAAARGRSVGLVGAEAHQAGSPFQRNGAICSFSHATTQPPRQ
jgi:hypothetical protein